MPNDLGLGKSNDDEKLDGKPELLPKPDRIRLADDDV